LRFRPFSSLAPVASILLLALFTGCKAPAPTSESTTAERAASIEIERYSIEQFLDTVRHVGGDLSPDGSKVLVSHDASGSFDLYAFPTAGGDPELLVSSEESVWPISYFPNDERVLYSSDQGGNELNHIYLRQPDGTVSDLTPGEELKAQWAGFTADGENFLIETNERDPKSFDLYLYDTDDLSRTLIFENPGGYFIGDLAPDRDRLLLMKLNGNADSDFYLHTLSTGETRHLTPHQGDVIFSPVGFGPEGRWIYYQTNLDSEFSYLARMDPATGETEEIVRTDWDVSSASFSDLRNILIVRINEDARTRVRMMRLPSLEPMPLPDLSDADITGLSIARDEETIVFRASTPRTPGDFFIYRLGTRMTPFRLTTSLPDAIDEQHLVAPEVVRFNSFDGVEIPGILYVPAGAEKDASHPAVVWVHGGPGGQSRLGWNALVQYLVNHGYVVYQINNRGSSGYGKTFFHMDDRDHGGGDLQDCVASKQMLIDTGYVDPDKIAIAGGSYGGYMVLAALAFEPEEFTAGVNIFGVSNWVRTLASIPPWWEAQRVYFEKEFGPLDDEEHLRAISPLFHAENIVRPLIVLQGANDPRVLQVESDEIVEAVKANGVPVEYLVFEDEGHGFLKKDNQIEGYSAVLDFLEQHVKNAGAVS
ncbi:MAG: alpha/beta fold hydrolase, partial [Acidobacteriota bacterium]